MTVLTLAGNPINWAKPPSPTTKVKWSKKDKSGRAVTGSFRTICHIEYLDQQARKEFGVGISIFQPPYNKGYKPSAGTHDYDACIDVEIPGVGWLKQQGFFRRHGTGGWWRKPPKFINHIHGFTLPPQEGVDRTDDFAILGFTVGKYIDGGWSLFGRKVASSQLASYYNKRTGLVGDARDNTWFPPDIKATIFDLAAFVKAQRVVSGNPPPRVKTHTVKPGESLSGIAAKYPAYKLTWQLLAEWNGVKDPDEIEVGQVLYLSDPTP
jgi:LysM repeat protein